MAGDGMPDVLSELRADMHLCGQDGDKRSVGRWDSGSTLEVMRPDGVRLRQ